MADALVSIALEKLIDVVGEQLSLFAGATRELRNLSSTFQSIQAVLDDAESRQASDKSVQVWLSRLRHVAYDIEDLVEDGRISGLGEEEGNDNDGNSRNKLCLCFPFGHNRSDYAVSRYRIARGIKEITERLDQIDVERNRFGFSSSTQGGDARRPVGSQRLTTSLTDESEMFIGRDNDRETIISKLVSGDGGQADVVAILGLGGLGKTTIARKIYNDDRVQDHFNRDLYWVCVSEGFDFIGLTKAILEQVKRTVNFPSQLDALQKELLEALTGKRFLLVLDDVWNDDAEKWKKLRLPLNRGAQGSRILVTTRGQKVANAMDATYTHDLQGLSDDVSWELFRRSAFAKMIPEECSKLENVGRQIVRKCGGVPLAITVMGSVMNSKRTMADWQNVLDSKTWSLRDAQNEILPALWLSYCNLPPELKQCFAYCSIFPKDWELEKDMLVRLWAAQGFIRSDGIRDREDIGEGYFDDLVAWSMFQEVGKNSEGKITCKMHDLLHDLAESIAKDEIYTFIGESEQCPSDISNVRHSYFVSSPFTDDDDKFNNALIALSRATKLRTFFLRHFHPIDRLDKFNLDIFHQARFVRALVFKVPRGIMEESDAIVKLPNVIGDLKHLRYLDLSGLDIVELPESVGHLRNLHTLNLSDCRKLEKLPRGIGGMVSLRHLEIEGTCQLKYLPKGLGTITGLRSLCKFIVRGGDEGEGCGIDELQRLNSLQGSLEILHLERVASPEEAERAELSKKQHLCRLILKMSGERDDDAETGTIDRVLEGLQLYENLQELQLHLCRGSKLPSWMDGMRRLRKLVLDSGPILERVPHLPSLEEFRIDKVRNEVVPDEGWERLAALQKLRIGFCGELKCLPEGLTQLPSLEQLVISRCDKFESLPEGLGQLKKLRSLTVGGSEVLTCLPDSLGQLESLENLRVGSCKKLESLPVSLGQLKKLKTLAIYNTDALRCVPDSVGQLESLESLRISTCEKLESLPVSLGQLKMLKSLEIDKSEVLRCVPDSVGQLESLESLCITSCKKLESLPVSLGQLRKLSALRVSGSEVLTCLPNSLGQLESLQNLSISELKKLETLPDSLGQLESLQNLSIFELKKLETLPDSLILLKKLKSLHVGGSEVLGCVPDRLGELDSLETLFISNLKKLETLPNSLGRLKKLKVLQVGGDFGGLEALRCLPDSVGQLESLDSLWIRSCKKLESLPDSLGEKALDRLDIEDCEALASLPQGLRHLRSLFIDNCPLLWERYKREGGVDWPHISHIPVINLNDEWIH